MMNTDQDALVCDLAETYGIFDMRKLPAVTVATLAAGLRDDSRIKLKVAGENYPLDTMLLAAIADRLSIMIWARTKDGEKGRNRPKMISDILSSKDEVKEVRGFASGEAFVAKWNEIIRG